MAYSSIGHMGFALVGLAANSQAGVRGVVIYMLIYMVMTLGTFAFILAMRRNDGNVEEIGDLAGPVGHQSGHGDHPDHPDVLAGRHSAARRLLRQVVRLPRRDRRQALCAGGHRRARLGGGRLLLSAHHQDHVVRRAGRRPSSRCRASCAPVLGLSGAFVLFYCADRRPDRRRWPKPPPRRSSRDGISTGADGHRSTDTGSKRTRRSARPMRWRWSARARAIRAGCGSSRSARRAGAAGAAATGQTPHGNLAATLLLVGHGELKLAATLGFVAGLALSDALAAIVPAGRHRHRRRRRRRQGATASS